MATIANAAAAWVKDSNGNTYIIGGNDAILGTVSDIKNLTSSKNGKYKLSQIPRELSYWHDESTTCYLYKINFKFIQSIQVYIYEDSRGTILFRTYDSTNKGWSHWYNIKFDDIDNDY